MRTVTEQKKHSRKSFKSYFTFLFIFFTNSCCSLVMPRLWIIFSIIAIILIHHVT